MPITMTVPEWEADLGQQVRRARMAQDLRLDDLSKASGVSLGALRNLETGAGCTLTTLVRVLKALGLDPWLGTLSPDPGVSPMDLLRLSSKGTRQRVRLPRPTPPDAKEPT